MSRINDVLWMQTSLQHVAPGSTLAAFFKPEDKQNSWLVKSLSGGSLAMVGVSIGMTLTAAQLVGAGSSGLYQFGTSEAVPVAGPACFYLLAQGSTALVSLTRGYGP